MCFIALPERFPNLKAWWWCAAKTIWKLVAIFGDYTRLVAQLSLLKEKKLKSRKFSQFSMIHISCFIAKLAPKPAHFQCAVSGRCLFFRSGFSTDKWSRCDIWSGSFLKIDNEQYGSLQGSDGRDGQDGQRGARGRKVSKHLHCWLLNSTFLDNSPF